MTDYTLDQKAVALIRNELWWRFPDVPGAENWSLIRDDVGIANESDLTDKNAAYHIGPTPPRVLTELEEELLGVLHYCEHMLMTYDFDRIDSDDICEKGLTRIRSAIAKAEGV